MANPAITNVQFSSIMANAQGWLKRGSIVTADVSFSQAVFVTGRPLLNLQVGSQIFQAMYLNGSSNLFQNSNVLKFRFTVGSNWSDTDGISLPNTALTVPNGASIKNGAQESVVLTLEPNNQFVSPLKVDAINSVITLNGNDANRYGSTIKKGVAQSLSFSVNELGTAYLLDYQKAFLHFGSATASQKKVLLVSDPSQINQFDLSGLDLGRVYRMYFADEAGNVSVLSQTITLENVAPRLASTPRITGATGVERSTLGVDDVVTFAVSFNEEVVVTGIPQLGFKVDNQILYANYEVNSTVKGRSTLYFTYTIGAGLRDVNGISINENSIVLNGGSIKDYANNNAILTHTLVRDNASYRVESTNNALLNIDIDGWTVGDAVTKDVGQTITFNANFGTPVRVEGFPKLKVDIGGTLVQASPVPSGLASSTVKFVATIPLGAIDTDGISLPENPMIVGVRDRIVSSISLSNTQLAFSQQQFYNYKVAAQAAQIQSLSMNHSRIDNPTILRQGDVITVTMQFTEAVTVPSSGALKLDLSGKQVQAKYHSGTGTDSINFVYTIGVRDESAALQINSSPLLHMNSGAVKDIAGFAANLNYNFSSLLPGIAVDGIQPKISSIQISTTHSVDGTVGVDKVITASVVFSEMVQVNGSPTLQLKLATTTPVQASYVDGSGTNTLKFIYTVANGDTALSGIKIPASALSLNGGTIQDFVGNSAVIVNFLSSTAIKIDAVGPSVYSTKYVGETGGNLQTLVAGQVLEFLVSYSERVIVTGTPTLNLKVGNTVKTAIFDRQTLDGYSLRFKYTVGLGDTDTDGIEVSSGGVNLNGATIKDRFGNDAAVINPALYFTNPVMIDTTPPGAPSLDFGPQVADGISYADYVSGQPLYQVSASDAKTVEVVLSNSQGKSVKVLHSGNSLVNSYSLTKAHLFTLGGGPIELTATAIDAHGNRSLPDIGQFNISMSMPNITEVKLVGGKVNSLYLKGQSIFVDLVFSENVSVLYNGLAKPSVQLIIGTTEVSAFYVSGTGSNTVRFNCLLPAGLTDIDGVALKANSLALNGGKIQSVLTGIASNLTHSALVNNINFRVDSEAAAAPTIDLALDTGSSDSDGITTNHSVIVSGLELGAKWQYSLNEGQVWLTGTGTSFTLSGSAYASSVILARQTDAVGNVSQIGVLSKTVIIDTTPYALSLIAFHQANGASYDTLNTGDVLTIAASFNETVTVSGVPELSINIGSDTVQAQYFSGSGGQVLLFTYTIQSGQNDANGISIPSNPLVMNMSSIRDQAGNNGNLNHVELSDHSSYKVDTALPDSPTFLFVQDTGLSDVDSITNNGVVNVFGLESGSNWQYSFNTGNTWNSGTGSTFTLAAGSYAVGSVRINQTDLVGNVSATGSHAAALIVDTTAATVSGLSIFSATGAQNGRVNALDVVTLAASFTEVVDVTGFPELAMTIGNTTVNAIYASGSGSNTLYFLYTILAGQNDTDGIHINANAISLNGASIKDRAGNAAVISNSIGLSNSSYQVDTVQPVFTSHGTIVSLTENVSTEYTLYTAAASDSAGNVAYSLDGVDADQFNINPSNGAITFIASPDYEAANDDDANHIYNINVIAADQAGNSVSQSLSVSVTDIYDPPQSFSVLSLAMDTGSSLTDGYTSNGLVNVSDLITGNTWQYTLDGGSSWINGTGSSFNLAVGDYAEQQIQVRQISPSSTITVTAKNFASIVVDTTAPLAQIDRVKTILANNSDVIYDYTIGSFYKVVSSVANWETANTTAYNTFLNDARGHLVHINSAAEKTIVSNLVGASYWLGGSDKVTEGEWYWYYGPNYGYKFWSGWANGTVLGGNYNSWMSGEPNGAISTQDYVFSYFSSAYFWDDIHSSGSTNNFVYVVEWDGSALLNQINLFTSQSLKVNSSELGSAYLVNSSVSVTNLSSILNQADDQWNSVGLNTHRTVLSNEDFLTSTAGWSSTATYGSVSSPTVLGSPMNGFLGRFTDNTGNQVVSKQYNFGASNAGKEVEIEFDMYEIDSWDGELFKVFINDVETDNQVYAVSQYSSVIDNADGGLSLGDLSNQNNNGSSTVYVEKAHRYSLKTVLDASGGVKLGFGSKLDEALNSESWGIDNISISTTEAATDLSLSGLVSGNYNLYTADKAGNLNKLNQTVSVTQSLAGQSVIDLGTYGKLIHGVQVEGSWYYYWDRSGDGSNANSGSLNGGVDYTNHDVLDTIFRYASDYTTLDSDSNTDDSYRYATLNGVKVALPVLGGALPSSGSHYFSNGTAINSSSEFNSSYDGFLAIWDAFNGSGLGTNSNGTPSGWKVDGYLSASLSSSGHAIIGLDNGGVHDLSDSSHSDYVALQVL